MIRHDKHGIRFVLTILHCSERYQICLSSLSRIMPFAIADWLDYAIASYAVRYRGLGLITLSRIVPFAIADWLDYAIANYACSLSRIRLEYAIANYWLRVVWSGPESLNPPLSGAYIGTVGHKLRGGSTIDGDTSLSSSWRSHDHVRILQRE